MPTDHPLRPIRRRVKQALNGLAGEFDRMYAGSGRRSIPPEHLIRALLLQILDSVRSERLLMEQLDYNRLFRWFVGLNMDEQVWHPTTFTKNRDRFLRTELATDLLRAICDQARAAGLLSDEHFRIDGTLLEAWASMTSVRPRGEEPPPGPGTGGRNPTVDFRGQPRANDTHGSTTDPPARMFRKGPGKETKLCYMGHVLMEHRRGLVVGTRVTQATGTAEREAGIDLVEAIPGRHPIRVGADRGYDTRDVVRRLRDLNATAHVAQNTATGRRSAIDGRTTRHPGYAQSQRVRKRIDESFGWLKTVGGLRKTRHRGCDRVGWMFTLARGVYNLVRMRNILAEAPP